MSNISTEIKRLRKLKGINQGDMAKALNLKRNTYTAKEIRGNFTEPELKKMATKLGTTLDHLLDEMKAVPLDAVIQLLVDVKALTTVQLSFQAEILSHLTKSPVSSYLNTQRQMVEDEAEKIWSELE